MIAGTLEVQMLANLARLADDMGKARTMVGSSMKSIEGAVASAKSALGALGIGLGVGYFVTLIKGSIDAMDHLRDLSKTTNIAVEDLAGLQLAARQSGGDLSSIADSINKLSQNMGKDAEKFRALGITAKEPLEAFKQLADIYTKLENPQQRAAVMAAALGKSWAGAAPLLSEGSAKIQEMVDKGKALSGVTQQMTEDADKFNDQMAELSTTLGATKTKLVGDLLPGMNEIAAAMREAAKEGGLLLTVWVGLGGAMANLLGMTEAQKTRDRLNEINDQLAIATKQLQSGTLNPAGASKSFWSFLIPDMKLKDEAVARLRETIDALEKEKARLMPAAPGAPAGVDPASAAAAAARAKAFLGEEASAKALREAVFRAEKEVELEEMAAQDSREAWQVYTDWRVAQDKAFKEGHEQMWKDIFKTIDDEQEAAIEQGRELLETIAEQEKKMAAEAQRFGMTIDLAFDRAVRGGGDLLDILKDLGKELALIEIKKRLFEPASKGLSGILDNLLKGGGANTGSVDVSGMAGAVVIGSPAYAEGTDYVPRTGWAMLHQGERVVPAAENRGGGGTYIIDARGADAAGMARLESMLFALHGSVERRAVGAVIANAQRGGAVARALGTA